MHAPSLRILALADTHLGIDLPERPRVSKRRRGTDFFANFERALRPALETEARLVIHGGDLLYRSRVPASLVVRALAPLIRVAEQGVPVFLVPGNHERSQIPYPILAMHPRLHVFFQPHTFVIETGGLRVSVSGFPFRRGGIRDHFSRLLEETGWRDVDADIRLLCLHESVEGARVGPSGYTFRDRADVVRGQDIPGGFAAVVSGHIHRHQVLLEDLRGHPLASPVLYPGSIERTSFAERDEEKGYLLMDLTPGPCPGGRLERWEFRRLPTRPMLDLPLQVEGLARVDLERRVRGLLAGLHPDSIVRLQLRGEPLPEATAALSAPRLRELAPKSMSVSLPARQGSSTPRAPAREQAP